jgi:hypothetical protein
MGNSQIESLFNQIKQEMISAVSEAESKTYLDALRNVSNSYNTEQPELYERTYQLKNSPRNTGLSESGNTIIAKVYLDQMYNYDTGTYSTPKVFSEAENGGSGIKLTPGFWKMTEKNAEDNLRSAMSKRFKG